MPRRSALYRTPNAWVSEGGAWPAGPFVADAPPPVRYAAFIAAALADALDGRARAEVARAAGLERSTLYDLLNGSTWADTITLAKLEIVLSASLWPERPLG